MISIVIPIYNAENHLDRCLSSIHKQSFTDFEAILVDDGSKDQSNSIAKQWCRKDSRFFLISQENKGVSIARNNGISHSTGETICFIDSDDYVNEHYLEKLYSVFHRGNLSVCNFVYNNDCKTALISNWQKMDITFNQHLVREFLVGSIENSIAYSPCNKLYDNILLRKEKITFPTEVTVGEDMIFTLTYLSKIKSIYFVNEGLYHYCIGSSSAMCGEKDYLSIYEKTLHCLQSIRFENINIDDDTLNLWARQVMAFTLTNPFVEKMSYITFKTYFNRLCNSTLFTRVKKAPLVNNVKKSILTLVARLNSTLLLYGIVKINAFRHGIR